MKKIFLYGASVLALGMGFASCDQLHNDLRLEPPTEYILQTPEGTDQLIVFGNSSNVGNEWKIVTVNPYNISTEVDFQMQVAKSQEDFQTWDELVSQAIQEGNSDYDFTDGEGLPYVVTINNMYTSTSFIMPGADFCDAINALYGYETEEEASATPVQVAYRVHAWVPNVEYSSIFSNVVVLKEVQSYLPIREPRSLYLVGQPNGWDLAGSTMAATEVDPGSNIYKGTFIIQAGQFMFRFYSELGENWNANSYGAREGYTNDDDQPLDIEFTDNTYFGDVFDGKGSWSVPGWTGGTVDVTINLNDMSIEMIAHEGELPTDPEEPEAPKGNVLYLIGACQTPDSWNIGKSWMWASETEEGSNIYEGVFDVPAGQFQFRFYSALGDWETNSVGSQNEDANVDITFTDGSYSGPVVAYDPAADLLGKGNWNYPAWGGGYVKVVINLNDLTIMMSETEKPIEKVDMYVRGDMNGWGTDAAWQFETTDQENVFVLNNVTISAGVMFKIADATWGTCNFGAMTKGESLSLNQSHELYYNEQDFCLDQDFTGNVEVTYDEPAQTMSVIFKSN